ncbi:MAG: leucine-rich repeat domain-containing protein, partial [Dethiobacteria bacterium]
MIKYGKFLGLIIISLVLCMVSPGYIYLGTQAVNIPDSGLEAAVRDALECPDGDITKEMMAGLISLNADNRGIVDLSGIEYATGLKDLCLCNNQISDLSDLNLPVLRWLDLSNNQINNLASLAEANLPNLEFLELGANQISNLTGLAEASLPTLEELRLHHNQISNLSGLDEGNLPKLEYLLLTNNRINSLSGLEEWELP